MISAIAVDRPLSSADLIGLLLQCCMVICWKVTVMSSSDGQFADMYFTGTYFWSSDQRLGVLTPSKSSAPAHNCNRSHLSSAVRLQAQTCQNTCYASGQQI